MRRLIPTLTVLMLLALTAIPALAQETDADVATWNGLGLLMVVAGLGAAAWVGVRMSMREASAEDDDLV